MCVNDAWMVLRIRRAVRIKGGVEMNIIEAAKMMEKGKCVRRPGHPSFIWFFYQNTECYNIIQDKRGLRSLWNHWRIDVHDLLATDWYVVEDTRW